MGQSTWVFGESSRGLRKGVAGSLAGESSRPPMESTVVSEMPEALTGVISALPSPDQSLVLLASNLVALHPDMEGDIVDLSTTVES